ncbi:MAG: cryptochrome/photolyase family protein [Pseudomonadota bacterium]
MSSALMIFPHQLFAQHPGLSDGPDQIVLIEDPLFFGDPQYPMRFHKQKLWLHRASMARYQARLEQEGYRVRLIAYQAETPLLKQTVDQLAEDGVNTIYIADPVDFSLNKRLAQYCTARDLNLVRRATPMFLNTVEDNLHWRLEHQSWFMAAFYKSQRRRLDVLMDGEQPVGGQWSFDEDNRKKVPKALQSDVPQLAVRRLDAIEAQARDSVLEDFADAPGSLDEIFWPTRHDDAEAWFQNFLSDRMDRFGPYEDAILEDEVLLWHAAITPMLNIGLLTPQYILEATLTAHAERDFPLNSVEGFLRQIIGWREFMRATYEELGVAMRTTNHWQHKRPIPKSFWTGETGIAPIDDTIKRILRTGYCHHIERLMVLGGFMFLCEFDPDDIYRWFMEMFVDSYDWVMVPNAYAMSQNADGGQITTKPYFSGSAYVRKMSNHRKGEWCETWDGLYWRWIWEHADALEKNPRWAMMVSMVRKMAVEKREAHLAAATAWFDKLDTMSWE